MKKKDILYFVDFLQNGKCYYTEICYDRKQVQKCRNLARALGEKIRVTRNDE